jgi:ectoine hydroxylase-related dioxygenase (phytanoyl-CoA dioxygenase family)
MRTASILPAGAPVDACVESLLLDGYAILPDAMAPDAIDALAHDLSGRFALTPFCEGDFYGARTKRFGALLRRSSRAAACVANPRILAIAQAILGPYADTMQLNLTQALSLHPGQPAQPPHRDQDMWAGPKGGLEYLINVMWPFTPYTAANGATLIWPDSHRRPGASAAELGDPLVAEMAPGAALLFLGSTLHAGGANVSAAVREGMIVSYCLGWLKPYENQWLVYPPHVASQFPADLARLVGYHIHRPNLGNVEGQSPDILFDHDLDDAIGAVDALPPHIQQLLGAYRERQMQTGAPPLS